MTDAAFRSWIETLRSCLSGEYSEFLESGEGRCIACHVRRARHSGTGYKPPYQCVPMTFIEHAVQHKSELRSIQEFNHGLARVITTVEEAKAWFDEQARKYQRVWYLRTGDEEAVQYGI
jgi:hypothetical protein